MATRSSASTTRLKNSYSGASNASIFEAITKSLATHSARRIMFDYDSDGQAVALQFAIEIGRDTLLFRLPARIENVAKLVQRSYRSRGSGIAGKKLKDQAYKTAWANIRDWVTAQMALIDSEMVQVEEVFLPYLVVEEGKTLFEQFAERRALPPPSKTRITEE